MARRLELQYAADTSGFVRGNRQVQQSLSKTDQAVDKAGRKVDRSFTGMGKSVARFAGGALLGIGVAAVAALAGPVVEATKAVREQQRLAAQTNAVLKSTGNAAGVTAQQIISQSEALEKKSLIDQEAIQSGQNMLLTFTKIRNEAGKNNDIFTQASSIMVDYATAMGTEPQQAALQLGKALNDPVKGIGALSKAGVQFTKEQKDQIKTLVDSGKTMDAQKIILGELQSQFGGSGAAAAATFDGSMKRLKDTVDGFIEEGISALLPTLQQVADWMSTNLPKAIDFLKTKFTQVQTALKPLQVAFTAVADFMRENPETVKAFALTLGILGGAVAIVTAAQWAWNVALTANPIGIVVVAIAALVAGLVFAYHNSETFRRVVDTVFRDVRQVVTTVISAVISAISSVVAWFVRTHKAAVDFTTRVIRAFRELNAKIVATVRGLVQAVTDTWNTMVRTVARFVTSIRDNAVRGFTQTRDRVLSFVSSLVSRAVAFVSSLRDRAANLVLQLRDRVVRGATSLRDRAVAFVRSFYERSVALVVSLRDRAASFVYQLRDRVVSGVTSLRDRALAFVISLRDRAINAVRALRDNASKAAYQLRDRVMSPFRSLYDRAISLFGNLKKGVGRAFGGILDGVKGPINTAFGWLNRNLIKPLNSVTSKFGLNIPDLPRFHRGTSRVGRGGGEYPAVLLGSEAVLNPRATKSLGRDAIDRLNRGEGLGGPSWWDNFTEFISKPTQLLAKMAEDGVKFVMGQILRAVPNIPTSGVPMADIIPGAFNAMKAGALEWAGKREAEQQAELGQNGAVGSIGSGPWVKPVGARIGNGYLGYPGHYGVDMPAGTGTPVHAVSNAIVTKAASLTGSYGKHLFLRHADGLVTVYAHLSRLLTSAGQSVRTGQRIGAVGSTGNSSGPHLHFETRPGGGYPGPNPRSMMAARGVTLDSGGMLPAGLSAVWNGTGGPEPVLTGDQWAVLRSDSRRGPAKIEINLYGVIDKQSAAREIRQLLEGDARSRGGVVVKKGT